MAYLDASNTQTEINSLKNALIDREIGTCLPEILDQLSSIARDPTYTKPVLNALDEIFDNGAQRPTGLGRVHKRALEERIAIVERYGLESEAPKTLSLLQTAWNKGFSGDAGTKSFVEDNLHKLRLMTGRPQALVR